MTVRDSPNSPGSSRWKTSDTCLLLLVTLLALVIRVPYWQTIPAAGDEVEQTIYAIRIAQGQGFPLVGNDTYYGPIYFYLLALLFRLGAADPLVGCTVVLIGGTLIAALTYVWVRQLRGSRVAALVAASLVVANPHLILLHSHKGGSTYFMPFLTTLFLWLLSRAVDKDHYGWLIASAVVAGLAIQSNAVAGLLVAGGWIWATLRVRRAPRLGNHWPFWLLVGGLCVVLVYSPVIIYNVTSGLRSVSDVGQKSYLWQSDPNLHTFLSNVPRLATQLVRQVSGVLVGDETFRTLLGLPLVYLAWMLAGLTFATRRASTLPILAILPFLFVFPYFSGHYGLTAPVRFTTPLTPVFAAGMGFLSAAVLEHCRRRWATIAVSILVAVLVAYPLVPLLQYYSFIERNHLSGRVLLQLSRQMVEANQGEPVYIGGTEQELFVKGIPYVPHAHLVLADIYQEFLPPEHIIGRLFERPGPATLLLSNDDAAYIQQVASLNRWATAANEEASYLGYGLYSLDVGVPLVNPDFVLTGDSALGVVPEVSVGGLLGGMVELMGYDVPDGVAAGETLELAFYWQVAGPVPEGRYIGFVHLYDSGMSLIAQDDHVLGSDRYPLGAWQPNEVVVERYVLHVPEDVPPGRCVLRAGVYTWPDLARLDVPDSPDNIVVLQPIGVD